MSACRVMWKEASAGGNFERREENRQKVHREIQAAQTQQHKERISVSRKAVAIAEEEARASEKQRRQLRLENQADRVYERNKKVRESRDKNFFMIMKVR